MLSKSVCECKFILEHSKDAKALMALVKAYENDRNEAVLVFKSNKYSFVEGVTTPEKLGEYIYATDSAFEKIRINNSNQVLRENYLNFDEIAKDHGFGWSFTKYGALKIRSAK